MAVKKATVDSNESGTAEIDALNQIRLSRNWSYQQLASDMARAGFPVAAKTLQALVNYRPKPYDRTLYQIRQYLASLEAETSTASGKKRASA